MTKQELQTAVEAKKGFLSIIKDELAPDHVPNDPIEKRFFYVNHTNTDGTAGKTFIFYLHDTVNDTAWFYNAETESVDTKEPTTEQKKLDALQSYLKSTFSAFFIIRCDLTNNWAEADTFTLVSGKLAAKKVLVFKVGTNPINHLEIV